MLEELRPLPGERCTSGGLVRSWPSKCSKQNEIGKAAGLIPQEGDPQIREVRDAILPEHDNLAIEVCGTRWQLCERLGDRRKPLGPVHPLRVSIPFRIPLSSGPIAVELYFMQPGITGRSLVDQHSELRRDEIGQRCARP